MANHLNRRNFFAIGSLGLWQLTSMAQRTFGKESILPDGERIRWGLQEASNLYKHVTCNGVSLIYGEGVGILDGFCGLLGDGKPGPDTLLTADKPKGNCGPVKLSLSHRLDRSKGNRNEDLLEATLELVNTSGQICEVVSGFLSGVRPCRRADEQHIYLPTTARGMTGNEAKYNCHQTIGPEGYLTHYLEPQASDPRGLPARPQLLVPVVDIFANNGPCRIAFFTSSMEPVFFQALEGPSSTAWRIGRWMRLNPGQSLKMKAYLLLHSGQADTAWTVFHQFGHQEDFSPVEWTRSFRVHYYDFLSAVQTDGPRGGGYDADLKLFNEFHVGMATQHGYYLSYGDFVHPDRKEWPAMPNDSKGPVTMSLEKMKARIEATRRAGVHPMIYLHYTILDEGSPLFEKLKDSIQVDAAGNPISFGWIGPDVIKKTWKMSVASLAWRNHLVQQAQWIMELLDPDGIVLDETFTAWGYDYHPDRIGPLSPGGIELMRRLRATVRSFGSNKALFASDCSMGNFCLWGDGEGGDHCYDRLLGNSLYRQQPVRYMAALGNKAWQPCAWLFKSLWPAQVDLARKVGAGVGVTNGWGDNLGLARLSENVKRQMIGDIKSLVRG
ncbi:MAG: hypothetical protein JXA82_13500 [Sedimentisphaerales bacterium]|nr:hypothetical protein [Sedimentisphaerales bacterium]